MNACHRAPKAAEKPLCPPAKGLSSSETFPLSAALREVIIPDQNGKQ